MGAYGLFVLGQTAWNARAGPDFAVAAVMAVLALSGAAQVLRRARRELDAIGYEARG